MITFNKQQEEIINTMDGNIAVIATAGSGKTSTLTYRIKNIIENYYCNQSSILAVTFSKKAKNNIILKLQDLGIDNVNVETFHSLALKIIIYTYGGNYYKVWTIPWEKEKLLQDICLSLGLCKSKSDVPLSQLFAFISLQKLYMKNPNDDLIYISKLKLPFSKQNMCKIFSLYEKSKQEHSYIEFDDFLNIANNILDSMPDIHNYYKNKFQYILVDEFQDISLSQSLLLKKLNTQNTMIVGDPLQAIYSFRGGDSSYMLNFHKNYQNTKVINLNMNYRCTAGIVNTANKLASFIPDSKNDLYVESVSFKTSFKRPELYHFKNEYKEAKWISEKILELREQNYSYDEIAILARTNAQLQKLELALYKKRIVYNIIDGKTFVDLPEIKLVISYLKLALNTDDDNSFEYLYNKPNRWLDKKFLEETKENANKKNVSLYESMFTITRRNWRFKNGINEIYEVINYIQRNKNINMSNIVSYLRKCLNIDDFIFNGTLVDNGNISQVTENLDSFENFCKNYNSLEDLILYLNEFNNVMKNKEEGADTVKLLTIHKSKGLEFPVVFIIGCNDELLPHYKSKDNEEEKNDERRLMYVAITRAENELYITYVDSYNDKYKIVSPFINEIKESLQIQNKKKRKEEKTYDN